MIKKLTALTLMSCLATTAVASEEIALDALGELSLNYSKVSVVNSYPGQNISAEVTFKKGSAFTLTAPRRIQQIHYLAEVGETLKKGQPFAELRGPEMHHFLTEINIARQLLATAEQRFKRNKILYDKKAIKESQWVEVSEKYFQAQLEYEHLRHFNDLLVSVDDEADLIVIGAPISGIVDYSVGYNGLRAGEDIAIFIPQSAIQLQTAIPTESRNNIMLLKTPHCELEVSSVGAITNNFFVTLWSKPIKAECNLMLGQTLLLTPVFNTHAFKVPKSAIFQWQGASQILRLTDKKLKTVEVSLLVAEGEYYIVSSSEMLAGAQVLSSSISAVQGILLGLGGE